MDSVFRALIGYSISEYPALFTDSPPVPPSERHQTRVRFSAVINKEISQLIKQAVPQIHEEGGEVRFGSFKALSFWLQFINETGEKVFCLQIQIKVKSCVTLFSWLVHNKLKTKFNNLFYRIILNTNRIHNPFRRNFPARAKQMQEKAFGHCAPKL